MMDDFLDEGFEALIETDAFNSLIGQKATLLHDVCEDFEAEFENIDQEIGQLGEAQQAAIVKRLEKHFSATCEVLSDLKSAWAEGEEGKKNLLDMLEEIFCGGRIELPSSREGVVKAYEQLLLRRIGVALGDEDFNKVIDAIMADLTNPATFSEEEKMQVREAVEEAQKLVCRVSEELQGLVRLMTLGDIKTVVLGLKDICVVGADLTAPFVAPPTLDVIALSAKSSYFSSKSAIERFKGLWHKYFGANDDADSAVEEPESPEARAKRQAEYRSRLPRPKHRLRRKADEDKSD